jgi:hypothetical protein
VQKGVQKGVNHGVGDTSMSMPVPMCAGSWLAMPFRFSSAIALICDNFRLPVGDGAFALYFDDHRNELDRRDTFRYS